MSTPAQKLTPPKVLNFRRYKEGDKKAKHWKEQIFQASWSHKCPTYVHRTPPCQGSCPSGEDIRGWLGIVRGMEKPPAGLTWQEYAFQRSTKANPFPSIMGRVCPAPCQKGCNRNAVEDFVGINAIEQFIGDTALKQGYKLAAAGAETGKTVAIIGGGPAGLSAAYQLRRKGHACTVFDDHDTLGGMMIYGIPGYRTPREVLAGEIKRILDLGVSVRLNTRVGRDISIEQLEKEFDAVLWAIGCNKGRGLPVAGWEGTPNCISGVEFLSDFNQQRKQSVPKRVIVVGGGDTSIDVASVARRLGYNYIADDQVKDFGRDNASEGSQLVGYVAHDAAMIGAREGAQVVLTSLFPQEQMTAAEHEVQDALREGVDIQTGVMPVELLKNAQGLATGLKMSKCTVDKKGIPTPIAGTEYIIETDLVVSAIGQYGDLGEGLAPLNNGRGFIDADPFYQVKGRLGHFVAGDIIRPHLLTTAIGQGAVVADTIDRYLMQSELAKRPKVDVHHFNLLSKLHEADLAPTEFEAEALEDLRGTYAADYAVHNYEDRSAYEIISPQTLFLGHFNYVSRLLRQEVHISADEVLGHFGERIIGLSDAEAATEAKRCMSCGLCFECDNCVVFCPQEAVKRTPKKEATTGRYVYTDYTRCIGCHICAEVCPTGYINMGLGE